MYLTQLSAVYHAARTASTNHNQPQPEKPQLGQNKREKEKIF